MKYSIVKYIGLVGALLLGGCNDWLMWIRSRR